MGEGEPARPGEARRTPARDARVLVGDFNGTPYWPWYRRMASQFTDVAVACANKTGDSPRATWGPWPGAPCLLRIDHGFVRGLAPVGFEVLDIVGSDHSAIVMDLSCSSAFDSRARLSIDLSIDLPIDLSVVRVCVAVRAGEFGVCEVPIRLGVGDKHCCAKKRRKQAEGEKKAKFPGRL